MENATSDMPLSNLRIDNDQSVSAQLDEASGTGTTISARYEISNMNEMDGHQKESEDPESDSSDSFIDDSDNDEPSTSGNDCDLNFETPLTEGEIEELIGDLLEVESKAAEAQESLEEESLARVESEVRAELAQTFHGDDLEMAVSEEMKAFKEQWETALDDLETESSHLLEQLDGAGIELSCLYKLIESLAPDSCCTEAWRKRAHWVGSQISTELNESITGAESYLQTCHPVRRKHGKLLEEGASGFLGRKFAIEDNRGTLNENAEKDWNSFNELFQSHEESTSFGSKHWASVYLASTPQQAANMGLNLPGVDEVEEIDDIESGSKDPFYADAVANEKETGLTEEQKKNVRKVKEEDDANIMRKLQLHLKQRRRRSLKKQQRETGSNDGVLDGSINVGNNDISSPNMSEETEDLGASDELSQENTMPSDNPAVIDVPSSPMLIKQRGSKHLLDGEGYQGDTKRARTVIIDSDDEVGLGERKKSVSCDSNVAMLSTLQDKEAVDMLDVRAQPNSNFNATEDSENFHCTACSEVLRASQVHRHPLLEVIICVICKHEIEETKLLKDPDCSECHCGWCGRSNDLITCSSCKMLFCTFCIKRNFGEERLSEIQASGWDCCCCSRNLLDHFILECNRALRVGGLVVSSSDAETDLSDSDIDVPISNKRRRKRRIRRILDDAELGEETKRKIAIEKERQEHLKSLQEQFAGKSSGNNIGNGKAVEGASVDVLGDAAKGYIVNVVREENEEPVRIPPSISSLLKPHQIAGIRFMWENCIQSVRKVKSGDKGLGCILAHTMGLGKTFQVIAFLYTALRSVDLGLKTALIVTPVNVLHNWRQEFIKWRPQELKSLRVFMLEDVSRDNWSRAKLLAKWRGKGGILLIGYAAFRNLSLGRHVKDKIIAGEICDALQNGPDVLVCDEAHMIKNTRADITQALKQVKSQRRIALTGSPLQNNLMEYYCMVDFVREGFLGSSHEFRNRFQNPIENGQHTNSTSDDVKIMNQRSHILYEQLKGFVHRMDISVMKNELPPKTVFVIAVKLSPLQRKLYKSFLDVHGFTSSKVTGEKAIKRSCFFTGYQALARIWNHPGLLQMVKEHRENLRREDAVENFLVDDSSSDDNMERDIMNGVNRFPSKSQDWEDRQREPKRSLSKDKLLSFHNGRGQSIDEMCRGQDSIAPKFLGKVGLKYEGQSNFKKAKGKIDYKRNDSGFFVEEIDWWVDLLHEKIYKEVDYSGKMVLLLELLSMSSEVGDKALVFSQSLPTLDLIELYFSKLPRKGRNGKFWKQGKDWYRLDGSTEGSERQRLVERFNDPMNDRVKCALISTRAGSLGINLHAANRVIVVDGSWNPTHDLQAIYRVWRYGQKKPVYAYRLMAHGTMEEKIYKRQVTKEGLAARVVDRQQIHRTMSKEEVLHLFDFGDDENVDAVPEHDKETLVSSNQEATGGVDPSKQKPLALTYSSSSSDQFMESLLSKHYPRWIANYHEHEMLLQENEAERLSKEEQDMAWEMFRRTFEWEEVQRVSVDGSERKACTALESMSHSQQQTKSGTRTRSTVRKCSNLAHLLTLRSRGIESGSSIVCGDCAYEISWENLHRDGKGR